MAVSQCYEYLTKYSSSFLLVQLFVDHLFEITVKTSSTYVFHHQVYVIVCLKCFDEFHDIFMVHLLEQHHLPSDRSLAIDIVEFRLIVNFDSILFVVLSRCGYPHHSVCTFSYLSSKNVVVDSVLRRWVLFLSNWFKARLHHVEPETLCLCQSILNILFALENGDILVRVMRLLIVFVINRFWLCVTAQIIIIIINVNLFLSLWWTLFYDIIDVQVCLGT